MRHNLSDSPSTPRTYPETRHFVLFGILFTTIVGCSASNGNDAQSSSEDRPSATANQINISEPNPQADEQSEHENGAPGNGVANPPQSSVDGELEYECPDQAIPFAITDIGPLIPMVLHSRAHVGDYSAWYRASLIGESISKNQFILAMSADWILADKNTDRLLRSCGGPYLESTQNLAALDISSNVSFSADLPAGSSLADHVRVQATIYGDINLDNKGQAPDPYRQNNHFPIGYFAAKLPTMTGLLSENLTDTPAKAPLQVLMSLELPTPWTVDADQDINFTLTYALKDSTTFTATSPSVKLRADTMVANIDESMWRLERYTSADGDVRTDIGLAPDNGFDDPSIAGFVATPYNSIIMDFNYLTESEAIDKLTVQLPLSFCSTQVAVDEKNIALKESLIEPKTRCNINEKAPPAMAEIVRLWFSLENWTYHIENNELRVQFEDGGFAEFSVWQ